MSVLDDVFGFTPSLLVAVSVRVAWAVYDCPDVKLVFGVVVQEEYADFDHETVTGAYAFDGLPEQVGVANDGAAGVGTTSVVAPHPPLQGPDPAAFCA